ncbi:tetratricopeptide repeat protein, partial [Streptomyces nigra]|uniref:tetratricopeptide repeat protein n=1 Tax=Streptomyces nigra TaxID=1827580 RepID=UPI0036669B18
MSQALVPLVPVVSWPRVLQPGQRYLVTVDIRLDTDAPPWPYDREEFAIGCMLEGGSGMTVEALGATTVVLHRFGGTYGPARFLTQLEAPAPQDTPQLTLTLITEGGVPFHTVQLPVRHAAQTDAPGLILDLLDAPAERQAKVPRKPPGGRSEEPRRSVPRRRPRDPRSRRDRVLGLMSAGADEGRALGSGYLIGPSLVLTCAHVVPRPGAEIRLTEPGSPLGWSGTVVWRGQADRDDAALVDIDDPAWQPSPDMSVRWGFMATTGSRAPGEAWGVTTGLAPREITGPVEHVTGSMASLELSTRRRHVFSLDQRHSEPPPRTSPTPWAGMSGAAVFCDGLLTGIVSTHRPWGPSTQWETVPIRDLLHDPSYRDVLARHAPSCDTEAECVEWQDLHETVSTGPLLRFPSPAALLRARHQVLPFRGRATLMAELRQWLQTSGTELLLLHGAGGQGKTRIAQQLANLASADGWGIVWLRQRPKYHERSVFENRAVPLLIIVDYADARLDQVTKLLETIADENNPYPIKLLLLSRSAGDWWRRTSTVSIAAEELTDRAQVLALPPLEPEPGDSRADAYQDAVLGYALCLPRVRGWEHHQWPEVARQLLAREHGPDLEAPGMSTALALHAKALADLLDTASQGEGQPLGDVPVSKSSSVEDRLLRHEERYWKASADSARVTAQLPMSVLSDALVAAFLVGAADTREAEDLLHRVPSLTAMSHDALRGVGDWIAALYPAPGSYWGSLEPDRLAERFVGRHLLANPVLADRLVVGASLPQLARLLTVWTRAATHTAFRHDLARSLTDLCVRHSSVLAAPAMDAATRTEEPRPLLDALHRLVESPETPLRELERLAERLPRHSSTLAHVAALLSEVLVARYRESARRHPDDLVPFAGSLSNLAIRLREVGRREEALAASSEAVRIRRDLAAAEPATHLPDLAAGLNNLSVQLGDMGRREEALATITEAVDIRRSLTHVNPTAFLPDLSATLNNLSIRLSEMGRRSESLAAITEATEIRRQLAQANPDAQLPDLALSLNNLANQIADTGQREEALAAITEAVDMYRALSVANPGAFLPRLADSLNNLSVRSDDVGRHDEALAAIREAVHIRRSLADAHPDAYLPDLAESLNNLALYLAHVGGHDEALAAIREAVDMYRALSEANPGAFLPRLADSLNNLSVRSDDVGRHDEAL